ncbi:MAG: hypothetical protein HYW07_16585 [Candidatus Latescibacteria bacterium]|nr:hypothetical protein [Candidatus Latescibacterota bacterium]
MRLLALCLALSLPSSLQAQSPRQAFWRSLLLPGWGQHYAGGSGLHFAAVEAGLWTGYLGLRGLEQVRQTHYRSYAAQHAGAHPAGKDSEYFDDLGFYQSRLQHDQYALYQQGPAAQLYPEGPGFSWEWDSEAARLQYRELRNASASAGRQALYTTGLVVANRVIAAVHAARLARKGRVSALPVELKVDPLRGRIALQRALW